MNIEEAKAKVLKFNPGVRIVKSAAYKDIYVFVIESEKSIFARLDPVCINAKTGVISIFTPSDKETYLNVLKLLK